MLNGFDGLAATVREIAGADSWAAISSIGDARLRLSRSTEQGLNMRYNRERDVDHVIRAFAIKGSLMRSE